jgi:TctA family transporter
LINLELLTTFFGWLTILNIGLLLFSMIFLVLLRGFTSRLHSKITGVPQEQLPLVYFQFIGNYKLAIFVFNLTPYIGLNLIS